MHIIYRILYIYGQGRRKQIEVSRDRIEASMAVGLAIASNGRGYSGKMTSTVILSCMVAATGGIIFGYDIGISGFFLSLNEIHSLLSKNVSKMVRVWCCSFIIYLP